MKKTKKWNIQKKVIIQRLVKKNEKDIMKITKKGFTN